MFKVLFILAVGILIGWNVPQPAFAKRIQDRIVAWVKDLSKRNKE